MAGDGSPESPGQELGLLRREAEDVESPGRDGSSDRFADLVDHALQSMYSSSEKSPVARSLGSPGATGT